MWRLIQISYPLGMALKNFKMAAERKDFSNSESLCHCDASHQFSAQLNGHHLNFLVATMPPIKFQLNPTYGSGGDVENVKSK